VNVFEIIVYEEEAFPGIGVIGRTFS